MRRYLIVIGLLAAVAGTALTAGPAMAARSCGTVTAKGAAVRVTLARGPESCAQARGVAKSYISGRGTFHGPPNGPRAEQYVTIPGGWRCSVVEQGAVGCFKGGSTYLAAGEQIGWVTVA
jgi:hypothetical protein